MQVADNYGPNKFLPLAVSYQWMYAQTDQWVQQNWQVQAVIIEKKAIKEVINSLKNPSLVALSCYVWNWEYNKALASEIKKKFPECLIVVGGPQVSKYDLEFFYKYPYFDLAVLGEGELAFKEILIRYPTRDFSQIPHTYYKGARLQQVQPSRLLNLSNIPSPILFGFYDWIIDSHEQSNSKKYKWQVTYETLRGCPYQCTFCDIGEDYWNKITKFDMDRIHQEINWMGNRKIEYVTVCDSNWGLLARDKDITEYVIQTKIKYGFPKFWDVTWAKNNSERIYDIAIADKLAGTRLFKGITFAMQSLNPDTLKATNRFNINATTSEQYLKKYQQQNISTYSELIWPMPYETVDSLQSNIQTLIDLNQRDFLMVHPLVITKNAPMANVDYINQHQLKYKKVPLDTFWLAINDLDEYLVEKVNAVYETNTATFDDMIRGHMMSHWIVVFYYYGWAHYIIEYISKIKNIKQTDIINLIIDWIDNKSTGLLYTQHQLAKNGIRNVFEKNDFWGIEIEGTYWEYKSATSVNLHYQRDSLYTELTEFLVDNFDNIDLNIVEFNKNMCVNWSDSYPKKINLSLEISKTLFNTNTTSAVLTHWDTSIKSDKEFIHTAYHYQRKNRYWRCDIKFD